MHFSYRWGEAPPIPVMQNTKVSLEFLILPQVIPTSIPIPIPKKNPPRIDLESTPNRPRIDPESIPNRPRIDPELTPNRPRIDPENGRFGPCPLESTPKGG